MILEFLFLWQTGVSTWDGSIVLAKYLEKHPYIVKGKSVLELGAGTGVTGMAAAALGASEVFISDLSYTLQNIVENVGLSFPEFEQVSDMRFQLDGSIEVGMLDWSDVSTYRYPQTGRPWDVIIGADVVWLEELVGPLVYALETLSDKQTVVLIAHQVVILYSFALIYSLSYIRTYVTNTILWNPEQIYESRCSTTLILGQCSTQGTVYCSRLPWRRVSGCKN
jgi:hypothetical protein